MEQVGDRIDTSRYLSVLRDIKALPSDADVSIHALTSGTQIADALLKISRVKHGKGSPRVKVLDIYPHPRFDLDAQDEHPQDLMNELWGTISASIVESINLIYGENPAGSIKLYGRTEHMQGFFSAVASYLSAGGRLKHLKVSFHSKWLEFRKA